MRSWIGTALLLLLAACAPQPLQPTPTRTQVFPGGVVQGRWVTTASGSFALPAAPLDVDANSDVLEVLYPYVWQRYRGGERFATHDLPARARAVRARPEPLVLLEDGLFTPEVGRRGYPARDAVRTDRGVYWVNEEGLWRERERLQDGDFLRVLDLGGEVLALGRAGALRWPGAYELDLPKGWIAADAAADLYLLMPDGVHRYDREGYELGFFAGAFTDLAVGPQAGVWLLTANGAALHLTLDLEEAW